MASKSQLRYNREFNLAARFERTLSRRLKKYFKSLEYDDEFNVGITKQSELATILFEHFSTTSAAFGRTQRRNIGGFSSDVNEIVDLSIARQLSRWLRDESRKRAALISETTNEIARVSEDEKEFHLRNRNRIGGLAVSNTTDIAEIGKSTENTVLIAAAIRAKEILSAVGDETPEPSASKEWDIRNDKAVRPSHRRAGGQKVKAEESFSVGGWPMRFPGDASQGAPLGEIINCRCKAIYNIDASDKIIAMLRKDRRSYD